MDPFRDELAAAHARIAELEATLARLRPRAKTVHLPRLIVVASLAGICGAMFFESPARAARPSTPSRTWDQDHLPYAWDDDGVSLSIIGDPKKIPERIDCFSGEYDCR